MKYGATGNYGWRGETSVAHRVIDGTYDRSTGNARAYCGRSVAMVRDTKPAWARECQRCVKAHDKEGSGE